MELGVAAIQPERDLSFTTCYGKGPLHSGQFHAVWKTVRLSASLFPYRLLLAPAPASEPCHIFADSWAVANGFVL